jgi:tetratricopeptide (TPR) repeat protein
MNRRWLMLVAVPGMILVSCGPAKKVRTDPGFVEAQARMQQADSLFSAGCHSCLKEALGIYRDLLAVPRLHDQALEWLGKTALLVRLREYELRIVGGRDLDEASSLIRGSRLEPDFSWYLNIVNMITSERKDASQLDAIRENLPAWIGKLEGPSQADPFSACLRIFLDCELSPYLGVTEPEGPPAPEVFPDVPLVLYRQAICPGMEEARLKQVIEREPRFLEAYAFLGKVNLARRQWFAAEENFLKAYGEVPESLMVVLSLAAIESAFEECQRSIEFYDEALGLDPEEREAVLGRVVCLSHLQRHEEALEGCRRLVELGTYHQGEAWYWTAWNQNELGRLEEAGESIERTKEYIIGRADVLSLSGVIAFKRGELASAEKDLLEALAKNEFDCEACFYLGLIDNGKEDWRQSGAHFGLAASCYETAEKAIAEQMKVIEESPFPEERKQRMMTARKARLEAAALAEATSCYQQAVGYLRAGMKEEAAAAAEKAARESALKEQSEALLRKIR